MHCHCNSDHSLILTELSKNLVGNGFSKKKIRFYDRADWIDMNTCFNGFDCFLARDVNVPTEI